MREYKNNNYAVRFKDESHFAVTNKFGDTYYARLNENNRIVAQSSLALSYAMKARAELNF